MSPKLINDGVSRFDSSFMTTSMPFRRAKATTFDFDPKSIPATDMIFYFFSLCCSFFLRFFFLARRRKFFLFPRVAFFKTNREREQSASCDSHRQTITATGDSRRKSRRERERDPQRETSGTEKKEKREEERKSAFQRLPSVPPKKREREREREKAARKTSSAAALPPGFMTYKTAILR